MVENLLSIAANEEDMRKVLFHMAENAAHFKEKEIGFGFKGRRPFADASFEDMYNYVKRWTGDWCAPVFAAPSSWNPEDYEVTSVYGSSMSHLYLWRDRLILCMQYETKWSWNDVDLGNFFETIPKGEYGTALFWIEEEGPARYFRSSNSIDCRYLGEGARSYGGGSEMSTAFGDIDLIDTAKVAAVKWGFQGRRSDVDKYLDDFRYNVIQSDDDPRYKD